MSRTLLWACFSIFWLALKPINAAEFLVVPGTTTLYVLGEIQPQDISKFVALTQKNDIEHVALNSPGGSLDAGLLIGARISQKSLNTSIVKDGICASSCALIFLHGKIRQMSKNSKIGFHMPFLKLVDVQEYCLKIIPEPKPKVELSPGFEFLNRANRGVSFSDCMTKTFQNALVVSRKISKIFEPTSPKWHALRRQGRLIRRVDQAFCGH